MSPAQMRRIAEDFDRLAHEAETTPRSDFNRVLFVSRAKADAAFWRNRADEEEQGQ